MDVGIHQPADHNTYTYTYTCEMVNQIEQQLTLRDKRSSKQKTVRTEADAEVNAKRTYAYSDRPA